MKVKILDGISAFKIRDTEEMISFFIIEMISMIISSSKR